MEKYGRSWGRIKEELIPLKRVAVVMPDDRCRVHYIKLLTEPMEEQKEIYEKLRLSFRPLKTRHIKVGEIECKKGKNAVNTTLLQKNAKVGLIFFYFKMDIFIRVCNL